MARCRGGPLLPGECASQLLVLATPVAEARAYADRAATLGGQQTDPVVVRTAMVVEHRVNPLLHSPRWSTSVWRNRTRARRSRMCSGGIHDSGSRSTINSSRRWRASARSVLGRFSRPRRAAVSAGSARCTWAPIACSSWTTNRQPVVASRRPRAAGRQTGPGTAAHPRGPRAARVSGRSRPSRCGSTRP